MKFIAEVTELFCVLFMIEQLIFIYAANAESSKFSNITNENLSQERSDRTRRSLFDAMPPVLTLRLKITSEEIISLNWVKQRSFLANEYLPVVTSDNNVYKDVMTEIGDFMVYHDFEKSSAVIYYKESNSLSGVISLEYSITNLPFVFENNVYQGPDANAYIKKIGDSDNHILPEIPDDFLDQQLLNLDCIDVDDIIEVSSDSDSESIPPKRPRQNQHDNSVVAETSMSKTATRTRSMGLLIDSHYLEILVIVTSDVVNEFAKKYDTGNHIRELVMSIINYFNAVDLIFRKIQGTFIHVYMNLAKIVIENDEERFDFQNDELLSFPEIVMSLREYLLIHEDDYPQDSFEHVFVFTSRPIEHDHHIKAGLTDREIDLYESRKSGMWYISFPITVMNDNQNFALAVHEISQTFGIKRKPWDKGLTATGQCHSIMQPGGSKCKSCLEWSAGDDEQFNKFFSENRNRCFLLNEPRSLQPPIMHKFLSPLKQCKCFGYYSYIEKSKGILTRAYVGATECNMPLKCRKNRADQSIFEYTLKPFDGTLCADRGKVCWKGKCEVLPKPMCKKS